MTYTWLPPGKAPEQTTLLHLNPGDTFRRPELDQSVFLYRVIGDINPKSIFRRVINTHSGIRQDLVLSTEVILIPRK
jgi:hypothetical protein